MFSITSIQNPKIKHAASLHEARSRREEGLYLIEGERELSRYLDALASKAKGPGQAGPLIRTFICEALLDEATRSLLANAEPMLGECILVTENVMAKISFRQSPASVLSIARKYEGSLKDIDLGQTARFVVAQGLEKPGNLGALWRVADAVGASAMILCGPKSDIWNPSVIRASMGSFFHLPAVFVKDLEMIAWAKENQVQLIAATPETPALYYDVPISSRCALVLGSEDQGLDAFWRNAIETQVVQGVRLPMMGAADSLNVSCAGSILLYDILRRQTQCP